MSTSFLRLSIRKVMNVRLKSTLSVVSAAGDDRTTGSRRLGRTGEAAVTHCWFPPEWSFGLVPARWAETLDSLNMFVCRVAAVAGRRGQGGRAVRRGGE